MSLTSQPLLVLLIIVTVLMPGLVVLGWGRVKGSRWLRVGQRVAMVLVAQVTALMLAGVALNDYGDFFSSWSQAATAFFGSAPKSPLGNQGLGDVTTYGSSAAPTPRARPMVVRVAASATLPPGLAPTGWSKPQDYATRGALGTVRLYGPRSQLTNTVAVYLPPAYFAGYRSLPLVEAITGYPSTYQSFTSKLALPDRLLAGIRSHTMGQFVVVVAPAGLPYPLDSECTDTPGSPFAFTYFDRDIPAQTTRLLGLRPPAMAAVGYSTGGYCATKLAMLDPGHFVAAASMSGYFHAQPGKYSPNVFGGSTTVRHLNDLRWRLLHLPAPRTSVLVMTGTQETGADGWINNNAFLAAVRAPMHAERFIVPVDFGHSYRTWSQELSPALVWVSRSLGLSPASSQPIGSALFSRPAPHRARHHRHARRSSRRTPAPTSTRSSASPTPAADTSPSPSPSRVATT